MKSKHVRLVIEKKGSKCRDETQTLSGHKWGKKRNEDRHLFMTRSKIEQYNKRERYQNLILFVIENKGSK